MGAQQQGVYTKTVYILLGLMVFFGACNTLVSKWQNSHSFQNPDPTKPPIQFHHPFMQSLTMFVGEFCSIFIFFGYKKLYPQDLKMQEEEATAKGLQTTNKKYLFLLFPAFCDFCSSCLQYVSLTYLNPSIYQMLRGGIVIITALFSKIFLKRILYKHNHLGIILVICGISLVGGANFLFPASSKTSDVTETETAIAIVLLISAQVFSGGIYISEEKIIRTYHLIPYEVVGTEGFWGIIVSCIFLPILCNVKCTLGENSCVTYEGETTFESPRQFLSQLSQQGTLFFAWFSGVITICCFNICGINVTKRVNSLARAVVDATRTFIIWIVGIILTKSVGGKFYSWENLRWEAIIIEIVGFLMLVAGNLTYNEIVQWPCALPPSQEQKDKDINDQLLQYSMVQTKKDQETKQRKKNQAKESFGSFHN